MRSRKLRAELTAIVGLTLPLAGLGGCSSDENCYGQNRDWSEDFDLTAIDGGTDDAGAATVDAGSCAEQCRALGLRTAGDQHASVSACDVTDSTLHCSYSERKRCYSDGTVEGRRPEGFALPDVRGHLDEVGAQLARMAYLEDASVSAFARLRRELEAHGAPRPLIEKARRAQQDEVRHWRAVSRLAQARGVVPPRAPRQRLPVRSLDEVFVENAVEGATRELFGALSALWQSRTAGDPAFRSAIRGIAEDEVRHAALALEVEAWASSRVAASARRRAALEKARAFAELERALGCEPPKSVQRELGTPNARAALALLGRLRPWVQPRPTAPRTRRARPEATEGLCHRGPARGRAVSAR